MNTAFLIIGSGIAGMSLALRLSKLGEVILISKKKMISGSTLLAQGGIAGSRKNEESQKDHMVDTLHAGLMQNKTDAVELLVHQASAALDFLQKNGVNFDPTMHTEAGHSEARIWHITDKTGSSIAHALAQKINEKDSITCIENAFAIDLLVREGTVFGAEIFHEGEEKRIHACRTILASGGGGQIFAETTNPPEATGDGIAMGVRAGAKHKDMEFIQFHPTALATQDSPLFLLSEALRGEGGKIVDESGEEICNSLLPRDQLSQIIFQQETNETVYLDLTNRPNAFWHDRFPTIFQKLQEYNISPEKDLIPIIPAAHFFCGGLETGLRGRTTVKHLSAVGEVACTGSHGANRLASNSLLEALVFSEQIAKDFSEQNKKGELSPYPQTGHFETIPFSENTAEDEEIKKTIQKICWNKLGIIRSEKGLNRALQKFSCLSPTGTEVKNMLSVAIFIAESAFKRKESLGCHFLQE